MKILTLQNNDISPSGVIGQAIREAGGTEDVRFPEHGDAVPAEAAGHDGLLVLGGTQHAADDVAYPYLPAQLVAIRAFVATGKPVLGICLGSQLLARALGGAVRRHHTPEIGFTAIEATAAGVADPLLQGLTPLPRLIHWHYDTFDLPDGAQRLATNAVCPNQAFTAGPGIYGLQFHLEVTAEIVEGWVGSFSAREGVVPDFYRTDRDWPVRDLPLSAAFARQAGLRWMEMVRAARQRSQQAA